MKRRAGEEANTARRTLTAAVYVSLIAMLAHGAHATAPCEFENTTHRRISYDNAKDWACIKLRAEHGETYWQFYAGIHLAAGTSKDGKQLQTAMAMYKRAARTVAPVDQASDFAKAHAMRSLGTLYLREPEVKSVELAYQWLYLSSQHRAYSGSNAVPEFVEVQAAIPEPKHAELRKRAVELLTAND